jgi:hypothetical protein
MAKFSVLKLGNVKVKKVKFPLEQAMKARRGVEI